MNGRLFGEEEVGAVQGQVAVDFVGGDLVIAADAVLAAGVHQDGGADDVGLEEDGGILDAAVYMAFGRKVYDDVGLLLLKNAVNGLAVADVGFTKAEVVLVEDGCKGRKIARIGQLVNADDAVLGMAVHQVKNKVAADKAGAAGDDDGHGRPPE